LGAGGLACPQSILRTPGALVTSRPDRYRLYVDESGDHTYKNVGRDSGRYLSLLGVWLSTEGHTEFDEGLDALKDTIFGPRGERPPIVLHRDEIVYRKGVFRALRNDAVNVVFEDEILKLFSATSYVMVLVTIDKLEHKFRYTSPLEPYDFALAAMLDRYCGWLNFKGAVGDVLAESRGGVEDMNLKRAYSTVVNRGTMQFGPKHFCCLTSKDIKVKKKEDNIGGLQLADLLAHPVKYYDLALRERATVTPGTFAARLSQEAAEKFNCNYRTHRVEGYGRVWLPKKQTRPAAPK
jgi:hypothetical protein